MGSRSLKRWKRTKIVEVTGVQATFVDLTPILPELEISESPKRVETAFLPVPIPTRWLSIIESHPTKWAADEDRQPTVPSREFSPRDLCVTQFNGIGTGAGGKLVGCGAVPGAS